MKLTDLRGHPVVVNFFASWWAACRGDLAGMVALSYQLAGRGHVRPRRRELLASCRQMRPTLPEGRSSTGFEPIRGYASATKRYRKSIAVVVVLSRKAPVSRSSAKS